MNQSCTKYSFSMETSQIRLKEGKSINREFPESEMEEKLKGSGKETKHTQKSRLQTDKNRTNSISKTSVALIEPNRTKNNSSVVTAFSQSS